MARTFNGSSDKAQYDAAIVAAPAFSLACWAKVANVTTAGTICFNGDSTASDNYHTLGISRVTSGRITAGSRSTASGGEQFAESTAGPSNNVWFHACGVWAATNSRTIYLNGGSNATNTTSVTPNNANRVSLGVVDRSSPAIFFGGDIAEAAMWSVALTAADALMLSLGFSPKLVRPEALVGYWPLLGAYSPEIDLLGHPFTLTGTAAASHPRIFLPIRRRFGFDNLPAGAAIDAAGDATCVAATTALAANAAAGVGAASAVAATTALAANAIASLGDLAALTTVAGIGANAIGALGDATSVCTASATAADLDGSNGILICVVTGAGISTNAIGAAGSTSAVSAVTGVASNTSGAVGLLSAESSWVAFANNEISAGGPAASSFSGEAWSIVLFDNPWICPPGIFTIIVDCIGGGGGGADGGGINGGGAGGGGGWVRKQIATTPGNAYPYTIGAGGSVGMNGGDTFFIDALTVKAPGGKSGTIPVGGVGGAFGDCIGDLVRPGGDGGNGDAVGGGGGGSPGSFAQSGGQGNNGAGGGAGAPANTDGAGGNGGTATVTARTGFGVGGGGGGGRGGFDDAAPGSNGQIVIAVLGAGNPAVEYYYRLMLA